MKELIEFKIGDKVMHSKEPFVYGVIKEVDRSPFGDTVLVVYDDDTVGYHRSSRIILVEDKND